MPTRSIAARAELTGTTANGVEGADEVKKRQDE